MSPTPPPFPARRRFVAGLAGGGVVAGLGLWRAPAWATSAAVPGQVPELRGNDFDLSIGRMPVDYTGRVREAVTVNGTLPAPVLRWREGEAVTLRVANRLDAVSSIHWHGLLLPANMDGVPGLSFDGIGPGATFVYRFDVRQSGTYWYHSHSLLQEQAGLYGAIVIDPATPPPYAFDREHVVLLSDWTDLDPAVLMRRMKKLASYDNRYQRTAGDFIDDVRRFGWSATIDDRAMWAAMRMTPTDLSDINANTYTYLMNGAAPAAGWSGLFAPGEKLLLRFVNGSAMTYFDVRIPGLKMTVVAADGQYIHPVTVDEFRIAVAETFDVLVEPSGQDAYTVFAQDMGRTGYARGTLAVRHGLSAPVPALDPRPLLTMQDMGHGAPMKGMEGGCGAAMGMPAATPAADPHAAHRAAAAAASGHEGHVVAGAPLHPGSETGNPLVDMQAMSPMPRLDDPGAGLRDNGRTVLTYAAMKSLFADPDGREPGREIEMHLTGHMEKFAWSFDGRAFMESPPVNLTYGERLRIVLVNDTMMHHPIHLHGMWSDLEDADGAFHLRKHTIDMPPGSRRSYRVRADALGRWAFHCHLLYHMEAGMMREVEVRE